MPYRLAVFDSQVPLTLKDLDARWEASMRTPQPPRPATPRILAFIAELTDTYPGVYDCPEEAFSVCPWSDDFDVDGDTLWLAIRFSRADEVLRFVVRIADRHGLLVHDTFPERVILPASMGGLGLATPDQRPVSFLDRLRTAVLPSRFW